MVGLVTRLPVARCLPRVMIWASGSDVAANYIYTTFIPIVKVNEALSAIGVYRIGSWEDPSVDFSLGQLNTSRVLDRQAPGIGRSFSPGYWQVWYVVASLPWGTVHNWEAAEPASVLGRLWTLWKTRVSRCA